MGATSRLTKATDEPITNGRKKLFATIFDPPFQRVTRQESIDRYTCGVTRLSLQATALGRALPSRSRIVGVNSCRSMPYASMGGSSRERVERLQGVAE